jgi:hypothetical protein
MSVASAMAPIEIRYSRSAATTKALLGSIGTRARFFALHLCDIQVLSEQDTIG